MVLKNASKNPISVCEDSSFRHLFYLEHKRPDQLRLPLQTQELLSLKRKKKPKNRKLRIFLKCYEDYKKRRKFWFLR